MVASKPHPAELRERAVQMVFELRSETGNARGSIARVGQRLGINTETLRNWVNKAEVDSGQRPGTTTEDKKRIAELEREVRELRRANETLVWCRIRMLIRLAERVRARGPPAMGWHPHPQWA
jgi:transposase